MVAIAKKASVRVMPKKSTKKASGYVLVRKVRKPAKSAILASVHETMSGLHKVGVVKKETMREFDELCVDPVPNLAARQIAELRRRAKVSQPVFAKYLNVSKSAVSKWESGEKRPDGAALKLLSLVQKKGLAILQ